MTFDANDEALKLIRTKNPKWIPGGHSEGVDWVDLTAEIADALRKAYEAGKFDEKNCEEWHRRGYVDGLRYAASMVKKSLDEFTV